MITSSLFITAIRKLPVVLILTLKRTKSIMKSILIKYAEEYEMIQSMVI